MIRLNEFLENVSIFTEINNVEPFPFIDDAEILDILLTVSYGNRRVFESFVDVNIPLIAQMIVVRNRKRWQGYIEIEGLTGNLNSRREVTETIVDNENRTNERDDINKVSAYNSDDLLPDGGLESTNTDTLVGEKTRTLTDEQIDVRNTYNMLNLMGRESIAGKVIRDVAQFLTLSIY